MPDEARLDELQKTLDEQQDNIKKLRSRRNIRTVLNILLSVAFIIICTFSIYHRYDETQVFDKPAETDENQQKIDDSAPQKDGDQQKTPDLADDSQEPAQTTDSQTQQESQAESSEGTGHFTIYSNGDVYTAENGSGKLHCDVRNVEDSTHDIVMSLYISEEEMLSHGLSTVGVEDGRWLIAQSGLFEPGYLISEVQLNALPDGSYLPAGTYSLTMSERYYNHETGVLASYEANIPVTLEVAN